MVKITERDRRVYQNIDSLDENVEDTDLDVGVFFTLLREELLELAQSENGNNQKDGTRQNKDVL